MPSSADPAPQEHRVDPAPHALEASAVERLLAADRREGLRSIEAAERLVRVGLNRLRPARRPAYARIALRQLADPLVLLLFGATLVSVGVGEAAEGAAIGAVIVLNAVIGFVQEAAAERAVLALVVSYVVPASVVRDGVEVAIAGEEVVPGDLLVLRAGSRVAADARVVFASGLEADESALTGESLPVVKTPAPVDAHAPLAERPSMVYAGTGVTRGGGRALVWATGRETQLGGIARLAESAKAPKTPLERRLTLLARQMVLVGILLTIGLAGAMLARGSSLHTAFLVGVAVAVAAVPEGLAASITGALALGSRALSRRGAIVRRLDAIETLGQTTVICTDKTDTLTEGRVRVAGVRPAEGVDETRVLTGALLASTPAVDGTSDPELVGDAIDAAVLLSALDRGLSLSDVTRGLRLVYDLPFVAERGRVTVVWDDGGMRTVYVKGAPEVLADRATDFPGELADVVETWADEGLRVLAVGTLRLDRNVSLGEDVDRGLSILGVIALHDPLRSSASGAVEAAASAGIEVRMVTGDHPRTARTIGRALGLPASAVTARATPEDKLRLVEELQRRGEVVAVTGDGINDAPALRRADVGIAMGRTGTEAAREAAAVVLTDDDFATIVSAIAGGRRIGDNIKKVVAFLLSANLGEVLLFAVTVTAGLGVPMAVIQVLLVNLVTDGLPALALARDPASAETMTRPPRRERALFDRRAWVGLAFVGGLVGTAALVAFLLGRTTDSAHAQTMAFATVALAELIFVFSCRSWQLPPWRLPANWWLAGAVVTSTAFVLAAVYVHPLHEPFKTVSLTGGELVLVFALAALPAVVTEAVKAFRHAFIGARSPAVRED
ncbi:MAG: cation-translocating P-type ATPase [Gaiellaceae bacterium]